MIENLIENGVMYLKNIYLPSLPKNFKTEHSLDCSDADITFLPDGLEVGGDLIIGNSYIEELPENLIVYGSLIMLNKVLDIPNSAIIGENIITKNGKVIPNNTNKNHYVVTITGEKVLFKNSKILLRENFLPNDFYFPELIFYKNISANKKDAVSYLENGQEFVLACKGTKDALYQVQLHRAKMAGIDDYKDYDIDEPRTVKELTEIYQVCTGACESGVKRFYEEFNVDLNKKYTIREVRKMVLKVPFFASGKRIFLDFFDPEKKNKESL